MKYFKIFFISSAICFFSYFIFLGGTVFRDGYVDCSDENDLYKYILEGWRIHKVNKKGDIVGRGENFNYIYDKKSPQIILYKDNKIKALNFGSRCHHLEGAELNFTKKL